MMAAGVYYNPNTYLAKTGQGRTLEDAVAEEQLLYYAEGRDGTVTVSQRGQDRYLAINGKVDASSHGDLTTQVSLGQLPALLHPNPRSALVIGLGTGITVNALATHSSIEPS